MKTKIDSLADFCSASHISSDLITAVVEQLGGWEDFIAQAPDIANHGIDGGFNGFIYTRETVEFALKNQKAIAELAKQQSEDFGQGMIEMVQSFNCLKGDKPSQEEVGRALFSRSTLDEALEDDGVSLVLNALAWYAGEEVSRSYNDLLENQ